MPGMIRSAQPDKKLPMCVGLRIIGMCNLSCPFCFGPDHSLPPIDTERLLRVVSLFPRLGVRKVVVTGGEPLLVPSLVRILRALKDLDLNVTLDTNGVLLKNKLDRVCSLVDWIALPLDADDPAVHRLMRPGPLLKQTELCELIVQIRSKFPRVRIRVATIITALNHKNVSGIPSLISGPCTPDVWKLYQFTPAGHGLASSETLEISDSMFEAVINDAMQSASRFDIRADVYRTSTRDNRYLFVEPNGDAMVIVSGKELVIGNWFVNPNEVIDRCVQMIDYQVVTKYSLDTL